MAAHLRTQIRNAAVSALTGLPTTGTHCYPSRVRALGPNELPALRVMTDGESIDPQYLLTRMLDRTLTLRVAIVVQATANLDATLDQIAKEVEGALTIQAIGTTLVRDVVPISISPVQLDGDGEQVVGVIEINYNVRYTVIEGLPDVAII